MTANPSLSSVKKSLGFFFPLLDVVLNPLGYILEAIHWIILNQCFSLDVSIQVSRCIWRQWKRRPGVCFLNPWSRTLHRVRTLRIPTRPGWTQLHRCRGQMLNGIFQSHQLPKCFERRWQRLCVVATRSCWKKQWISWKTGLLQAELLAVTGSLCMSSYWCWLFVCRLTSMFWDLRPLENTGKYAKLLICF